ncbi:MAG: hypothetical protein QOD77_474 [Thermoplasmata archaeon]|jgi:hypothetical protein|nr:hypothetical protein [Thermoplasmata archaeon]
MNTHLKLLLGLAALLALAGVATAHWQIDTNGDGDCDDSGDVDALTPTDETEQHHCSGVVKYVTAWAPGDQ